uniref:Uncharacterized protein n=1 Tax=Mustela putorius furo TaxID=9669 RepID=M3YDJ8_MUSPF
RLRVSGPVTLIPQRAGPDPGRALGGGPWGAPGGRRERNRKKREREHKQGEQQGEGEEGSLWSKEPSAGLHPRTSVP